ncbi:hypothetical protein AB0I61_17285 [Polymorphospora rubra]|uniref:hypothetical protein n=1 Tax=Polymorphospora rubra TaxID=338584 RepID=UPI0033EA146D
MNDRIELATLEQLLHAAEDCAARAQVEAGMAAVDDSVPAVTGVLAASRSAAWAQASQAWSALAAVRIRAGARLEVPEEPHPRDALRQRVDRRP